MSSLMPHLATLLSVSDLPEIKTTLPEIETALPEIKTALPEIEILSYDLENKYQSNLFAWVGLSY